MSFFTKWFKKENDGEEETDRGNRTFTDTNRGSSRGDGSWTVIPEHRPNTQTLSRYVLLKSPQPPPLSGVLQMLRMQGVEAEGGVHEDRVIVHYRGMTVTTDYMSAPLPNGEVEDNCKYNRLWPEAEEKIQGYSAHLLVTLRNAANGLSGHRFLTQFITALVAGEMNALAVYSAPLLVSRADYLASAELMKENELPVNLWVFVGLYASGSGGAAYTHGMADFGADELEMLDSKRSGNEIFELTFSVVHYAIAQNIRFQGGEEVSFGEQSFRLNRSGGVALQGMTVKIEEG